VPFPTPRDAAVAAEMKGGGIEIPYHHFSVIVHENRRLALITGANVDARPGSKRPENRPDQDYSRDGLGGLGEDDQERWFLDGRLRPDQQLPDRFFHKDRKAFDKGHLVRREDVAWGSTYEEVRFANGDTFHVTNCSPQVAGFNRSAGRNWGALENQVLAQAAGERLSVFSGPVLDEADRSFRGVDDENGTVWVPIPSRYWKVIVAERAGRIESYGFVLEQDLSNVPFEFAVAEDWAPLMRPIRDIEEMAKIVFPDIVRSGDQFATPHGIELARESGVGRAPEPAAREMGDEGALAGLIDDIEPVLEGWRAEQARGDVKGAVRFTLNFPRPMIDEKAVAERLKAALRLDLLVEPLFDPDPELDRFRRLSIPGVSRIDRQDMFDLARVVRTVSGAESVDPDLGSDYYDYDPPPGLVDAPPGPALESSIAFWCWAGDDNKPADSDWAVRSTRVPEAWAFSAQKGRPQKGEGILVFQPDTGVVAHHGELGRDLHLHPLAGNFVEPCRPALDPKTGGLNPGHGTGTGSVVVSDEPGTMRGVAPLATLIPVRCVENVAIFDQSPVAKAIDHARTRGAHVITMSLGGVFSEAMHAAVRKAVKANIIVIAAAGNCVREVVWPARYAETIAVAGINAASKPWRGSSRGRSVAISGPAEFVLRADPRDDQDPNAVSGGQGTSFATAHLAGVAALWLAHHGRAELIALLPPGRFMQDMFRAVIRSTARIPPGFDTGLYGAGIINVEAALKRDPAAALAAVPQPAGSGILDQLTSLLDSTFGGGAAEAAAPALADRQNYPELAAAAFERLRAARSSRAAHEAMPPVGLSIGLRRVLGSSTAALVEGVAPHEF
jgi:DNA/RNA endonuclease G (NUC1)/subtilisin family serine protease